MEWISPILRKGRTDGRRGVTCFRQSISSFDTRAASRRWRRTLRRSLAPMVANNRRCQVISLAVTAPPFSTTANRRTDGRLRGCHPATKAPTDGRGRAGGRTDGRGREGGRGLAGWQMQSVGDSVGSELDPHCRLSANEQ